MGLLPTLARPLLLSERETSTFASSCAILLSETTSSLRETLGIRRASCAKYSGGGGARFLRRKPIRDGGRGGAMCDDAESASGSGSIPREA